MLSLGKRSVFLSLPHLLEIVDLLPVDHFLTPSIPAVWSNPRNKSDKDIAVIDGPSGRTLK